jgi:imidazolonepropionase-like amidohydrolase
MLISDVTLIDGTDAPPEPHMSILIRDGRIATVAAAGEAPPATSVRVIDGRGSYVIPGLIDGHVHLTGRDWQARVTQLEAALRGGVTAVFELAGDTRITGDLARAVLTHEISGPTIYYSAVMAGPPFFTDPRVIAISRGYVPGTAPWAQAISAQTDMTQAIAAARGTGATMIKLYASLDSATVVRATAEAHRQRMHVVAHATTFPARPSDLVDAGVDMLAHTAYHVWNGTPRTPDWTKRASGDFIGVPANSPAIEHLLISMRDHHVALNPTLWVFDESQPADSLVRVRQAWTDAVTKRALDLGVTIVAGTDEMLNPRQDSLPTIHRELQLEVRAGLTPLQAIRSATLNAARTIGVDSIRGTIAPGRVADLVLLDANPAEDIANTRRIRMVIKDGQVVDRSVRVPITRDR